MGLKQLTRQITPTRIAVLDKVELPASLVFLEARFTMDSCFDISKRLIINEYFDSVFLCEPWYNSFSMFPGAARKVIRDADIKRPIALACQDINIIGLRHRIGVT